MLCLSPHDPAEILRAQARRSAAYMVKCRARDYARRPMQLEILYPGLAVADPSVLIAVAAHLMANERKNPRRWFSALNAKAALLLGRTLRRSAHFKRLKTGA